MTNKPPIRSAIIKSNSWGDGPRRFSAGSNGATTRAGSICCRTYRSTFRAFHRCLFSQPSLRAALEQTQYCPPFGGLSLLRNCIELSHEHRARREQMSALWGRRTLTLDDLGDFSSIDSTALAQPSGN